MCGIYGKLRLDGGPADAGVARAALARLAHRGPDGEGLVARGPAVLAHRRLALVDLSPAAAQPLANERGDLWLVANGEIYDAPARRRELERGGHRFASASDVEVVLHLYEEIGLAALAELSGMFALALWDERTRTLLLARDRLGEKPLFVHRGARCLAFASEPVALLADPEIPRESDPAGLAAALVFHGVPAPRTAFRAIEKLRPGHWLRVADGRIDEGRFWRPSFAPGSLPQREAVPELRRALRHAVATRLAADAPVGLLLSGGLDSSGVAAIAREEMGGRPLPTFTAAVGAPGCDESAAAARLAARLGLAHRIVPVGPGCLDALPLLVERFGEPHADPAALALHALARAAAGEVKAALTGDGGDELFGGYPRHRVVALLAAAGRRVAPLGRLLPEPRDRAGLAWVLRRASEAGSLRGERLSLRLHAHFPPELLGELLAPDVDSIDPDALVAGRLAQLDAATPLARALADDLAGYLPDVLLAKADVAAMAVGLELRAPLLDPELVALATALPDAAKVTPFAGKIALRRALAAWLPRDLLRQPKRGFSLPLAAWLRGPWRPFLHDHLGAQRARERPWRQPAAVARLLAEHDAGRADHGYRLYNLLVRELWERRFLDP
ncbi:MAG TPA: asparagine synthase (glutamine-hydrolyzing) [Thermoanaerobaculia bacterium]|nr:asparagine synthase (glutamine-hydrolyzing) [Thermoanaerobaculia bacterium]